MTSPMTPLMTTDEVAAYLNLNSSYLAKLRKAGEGPDYVRLTAGSIRYRKEDVDNFVRQSRIGTPKKRLITPVPNITAETDDVIVDEISMEIRHPGGRSPEEIATEVLRIVRSHGYTDASYGTMLEPYEEVFP